MSNIRSTLAAKPVLGVATVLLIVIAGFFILVAERITDETQPAAIHERATLPLDETLDETEFEEATKVPVDVSSGSAAEPTSSEGKRETIHADPGAEAHELGPNQPEAQGLTISGRVEDLRGHPIPSAMVQTQGPSGQWTETDAEGRYTLEGLAEGIHWVSAWSDKHSFARPTARKAGSRDVDFYLPELAAIEGRVVEAATGKPITSFRVGQQRNRHNTTLVFNPPIGYESVQDPNGRFRLSQVEEGLAMVTVQAEGYADATSDVLDIVGGQIVDDVVLRMEIGAEMSGTVVTRWRTPVSSAEIFLGKIPIRDSVDEPQILAHTDADGRFRLTSLPAGAMTISAQHEDFVPGSVEVILSNLTQNSGEIVLHRGGVLEGRVWYLGSPAVGATVEVQMAARSRVAKTKRDGTYRVERIPSGLGTAYASVIEGDSLRGQEFAAVVEDEQTTTIDFSITPRDSSIEGTVYLKNAALVHRQHFLSASVTDLAGAVESFETRIEPDGGYEFENLPSGSVELSLYLRGSPPKTLFLELGENQRLHYDISLLSEASLQCEISDFDWAEHRVEVLVYSGNLDVPELNWAFISSKKSHWIAGWRVRKGRDQFSYLEPGIYTVLAVLYDVKSFPLDEEEALATAVWQRAVVTLEQGQEEVLRFDF